jgi:hypothetical protein
MLIAITDICKDLDNDLKQIDNENTDILKKSEQSILCIINYSPFFEPPVVFS